MKDNIAAGEIDDSTLFLKHYPTLLNSTPEEILEKFAGHSFVQMDYLTEKGIRKKAIEIQLDNGSLVVTFLFNIERKCDLLDFFINIEIKKVKGCVIFLKEYYDYDFIRDTFMRPKGLIKVNEITSTSGVCMVVYGY